MFALAMPCLSLGVLARGLRMVLCMSNMAPQAVVDAARERLHIYYSYA